MTQAYLHPLAVNFIWHPSDSNEVIPILDFIRMSFARNKEKPFSRGLNIPLFFFSTQNCNETPSDYPEEMAKSNIVFIFTSVNTVGREAWKSYIEKLPILQSIHIVPIAISSEGIGHERALFGVNYIRMYEWPIQNKDLYAVLALSHEIYRYGFISQSSKAKGTESSLTIFLSHSKKDNAGKQHSEQIKKFIDNTNMKRFFDANEISAGYQFDQEIERHVQDSTLLAIETDAYSSRYWCQREILVAKEHNRPVIIVNCLDDFEDRIFPAASNVPCVNISSIEPITDKDILRILSTAMIETVRFNYSIQCLEGYKLVRWIDADCGLSARPPELRQVLCFQKQHINKICYPEPPIYSIEADWHEALGVQAFTPLWNPKEKDCLSKERVGISISEVSNNSFSNHHIHADHLVRLTQDIARHLLARSATLLYGGDLRPGDFTEFILDEASILKDRLEDTTTHVENHLAWPLYLNDTDMTAWRAKYNQIVETITYDIPNDSVFDTDKGKFLKPDSTHNSYIWSRCLTKMRQESVAASTARICAGGKFSGYMGKMPGVLEEILLALDSDKPIFLLGAFGGLVGDVCKSIINSEIPDTLTEKWQISNNENYFDLQSYAREYGHSSDYDLIAESLSKLTISELSEQCGLEENEYKRVMVSPFIDECIYLIMKGLNKLSSENKQNITTDNESILNGKKQSDK